MELIEPVKQPEQNKQMNVEDNNAVLVDLYGRKRRRYFRYIYNGETKGRYANYHPIQAAKKAFSTITRGRNDLIGIPITFGLVECTRGHRGKRWTYQGTRSIMDNPKVLNRTHNGKTLQFTYKYANNLIRLPNQ